VLFRSLEDEYKKNELLKQRNEILKQLSEPLVLKLSTTKEVKTESIYKTDINNLKQRIENEIADLKSDLTEEQFKILNEVYLDYKFTGTDEAKAKLENEITKLENSIPKNKFFTIKYNIDNLGKYENEPGKSNYNIPGQLSEIGEPAKPELDYEGWQSEWEENNRFLVDSTKGALNIIGGEFSQLWQGIFGEANSVFERIAAMMTEKLAMKGVSSLVSLIPGVGPWLSAALGHSGGDFVGVGNGSVMKLARGADFLVPPGYNNDSFGPLFVETGERVRVTPAGQVNNYNNSGLSNGDINKIVSAIQTMNLNLIDKNFNPKINVNLDGKSFTKEINREQENISKSGYKDLR